MIVDGTLRIDEDLRAITALTLIVSIAIGILAGQLG